MPIYEYRCPHCETRFDERRPVADADAPVQCPQGHDGARRLLSVFAAHGRGADAPAPSAAPGGGCGGACACHPG